MGIESSKRRAYWPLVNWQLARKKSDSGQLASLPVDQLAGRHAAYFEMTRAISRTLLE
jgi:hypothetical protein